uniref:Uncharacterized protein n=1 Tax=Opuntia streptacantha TaxID=393608 RepID=A0A7C9ALG3_OPUST
MNMMPADATPTPICSSLISKLYRFAPMSLHRRRTATSSSLHTRPPNPSFSHGLQSIRLPNFRSQKRSLVIKASASPPLITDNRKSPDLETLLRRFWKVAKPYWSSEDKVQARWRLAAVFALTLGTTGISVAFNFLGRDFYNALASA